MQTTKQQLLVLLKRSGTISVEQAAVDLSIASMTARQHLVGLERDGLILAAKAKRSIGRPRHVYSLTPKGEQMFPQRYDLLAEILLQEIGSLAAEDISALGSDQKQSLLILRTADRLAELYQFPVEGRSVQERVAAVTDILHLIGGFAEWREIDSGLEIRDYNCVFARLMPRRPASECEWHVRLLTQLLKWPVSHELVVSDGVECCRYVIDPRAAGIQGERITPNA